MPSFCPSYAMIALERIQMVADQEKEGTPEAFVEQIKDALEHLYDLPYLQQLPLTHAGFGRTRGPAPAP